VEPRSQIELPDYVSGAFDVFVNGVPQQEGLDYDRVGRMLVFRRELAEEGRLGFWRWLSMFLGIAGTYRKNDSIDVAYTLNGRQLVSSLQPIVHEQA
jgi:hypothetical protein